MPSWIANCFRLDLPDIRQRQQIPLDNRLGKSHCRLMTSADRFINELFRIVNGALRLDIDKVRNYTSFLADKLDKEGDTASASRLRKMLEETDHQLRPAKATFSKTLPVDSESRFPLLEQVDLRAIHEPRLRDGIGRPASYLLCLPCAIRLCALRCFAV